MDNFKPKYDILVFDFDNTLCNMNINLMGAKTTDINEKDQTLKLNGNYKSLNTLFNDYSELVVIFTDLKKKGVKLCIASFGDFTVIKRVLSISFPNTFDYILTTDNIDAESNTGFIMKLFRHIIDPMCPRYYGKNIMLKTIIDKFNIQDPTKILFLDDDYSNAACSSFTKVHYHNNTKHGITSKLLIDLVYDKNQSGGKHGSYIRYVYRSTI
ncbi:HAD-superfamily phosphatase subfamily IIIC [Fadolivirus algeromassiliense]|jgi:HAD superfamily phosphatase (TIGR01681 family)|uniref:HAD-superfamily phosphatase subfamily IIIC n=1 Tax=Fadolivirus FV1/VV64 TaxID=3070911 RepID=A0A7D3QUG6_9VIRU|nr:HAD-superfamily phosphatase subfamily IIIC [Fadolivirus algeromassiliense]QKF94103.1 HAD-superfamily phosphatase subfamily IIIC [Fadolivirus FV1/VV64]